MRDVFMWMGFAALLSLYFAYKSFTDHEWLGRDSGIWYIFFSISLFFGVSILVILTLIARRYAQVIKHPIHVTGSVHELKELFREYQPGVVSVEFGPPQNLYVPNYALYEESGDSDEERRGIIDSVRYFFFMRFFFPATKKFETVYALRGETGTGDVQYYLLKDVDAETEFSQYIDELKSNGVNVRGKSTPR